MLNAGAAQISYIQLTSEEVEGQKLFGFTSDHKVRVTFAPTFTDHGARRRADVMTGRPRA
jgi:hypothetical protein